MPTLKEVTIRGDKEAATDSSDFEPKDIKV